MPESKPAAPEKPTAEAEKPKPSLPSKVRLVWPYGFIDENGRHRAWKGGDVVADPAEIALLIERKAPCEPVV